MTLRLKLVVALLALFALFALFALSACADPPAPTGPANCEPPEELQIERSLKDGYRAAAEGALEDADIAFRSVLELAPDHPEARAGQRLVKEMLRTGRSRATGPGNTVSP